MALIDPIEEAEKIVRDLNSIASKHARPILRRYPLVFAFLITFGVAAILDGLKFFLEKIEFFKENPSVLILIGIIVLLLTGTLYKVLTKREKE